MKLSYTPKALSELAEVLAYIAQRSPQGARDVQRRVQAMIGLLPQHPRAGQMTSEPRLRRLVVTPYPYLVFYEVTQTEVIVVGVRHAARDPSATL